MKKQLLSVVFALAAGLAAAQPAAVWSTTQNPNFPQVSTGIRFMDAVDQNVLWTIGYDGTAPNRNYNWYGRSINGGASFNTGVVFASTLTPVIGDTTTYQISNLCGIDANTAWVCAFGKAAQGGGVLYKTTNGGANWINVTPPAMFSQATAFGNFVAFLTPSVAIVNGDPVGGEYELWRTIDGGLSWSQVPGANIPNPLNANEYAIVDLYAKQGTSNLWFATNQGRMYRTTDAGVNWSVANVCAPTSTIIEIAFVSPLNGVVYAVNGGGTFEMYNTSDGGVNWSQIGTVSTNVGRNDIVAIPGTGVYASCGAGTGNTIISYSSDNGVTWQDWGSVGVQYLTLDFVDASTGWAGSFSNNADPSIEGIFKYTGPAIGGTVTPTAAFTIPSYTCGPNATISPVNLSTGSGLLSYTWAVSPAATVASPNASNTSISFAGNNTYTVTLTVSSSLGSNTSSQVFQVLNCTPPVASFNAPASACKNAVISVTNTSVNNPAATYAWSTNPAAGVTFPNSNGVVNPTIKFTTAGVHTIQVIATSIGGSVAATQTINITDCTPNAANFNVTAVEGCAGQININGQTLQSVGSCTVTFPGHQAGNSYTWNVAPTLSVNPLNYGVAGKILEFGVSATYTITLTAGNISGVSAPASKTVQVDLCINAGINDNGVLASQVNVFPNPAHDVLNVRVPAGSYDVQLVNVLGVVVHAEKINKENFSLNLAGKAKGVYFLSVENSTGKATKKIVVE